MKLYRAEIDCFRRDRKTHELQKMGIHHYNCMAASDAEAMAYFDQKEQGKQDPTSDNPNALFDYSYTLTHVWVMEPILIFSEEDGMIERT